MNILVPTRNNPSALAGLLSSILSATAARVREGWMPSLYLMDGSNDPAITDPHVSRLLTRFHLFYQHFLEPQVNVQRLAGLRIIAEKASHDEVLLIDDDHILLTDPSLVFDDLRATPTIQAFFGVCPDIINDKGYRDFALATNEGGHHSFARGKQDPKPKLCRELSEFSANPGFMITRAAFALGALAGLHASFSGCPAVADDAWAKMLADPPYLHTGLQALHVGNKNRWWNQWGIKHTAVTLAVKEQLRG